MIHRIKSRFYAGLCCGLVIFASIPHTVFAQPLIKQTQSIREVQNEISYFPNARMEEVSPSLLEEENPSADLAGSPRAGETLYRVSSADEWNALLSGVTDSALWSTPSALNPTTGIYNGTEDVRIILDRDIVGTMDSITLSDRQVTFTLDLNGHSFQTQGGTLSIQSVGSRTNTLVLQNGNMAATGINANSAMGKIGIQNVDFTDISGNAVSGDFGGECFVSHCTFSHEKSSNNHTAILVTNFKVGVEISDVTISDFGNGINASYAVPDPGVDLSNVTVSGANIGLDLSDSKVRAQNVTLSGNKASGSRGVNLGRINGAASDLEDFLFNDLSDFSNVTISDFDSGILSQGSGTCSLDHCEITNVNLGLVSNNRGTAHFNVRDSVLEANASIAEGGYSGDSYGIYAYDGGFSCVNTEVTGFQVGAYSRSSTSAVANCTFDNLEYNIDSYYFDIYNSVLKNAKYGIKNNGASSLIMDTEVIGKKTPGGIGIQEMGTNMSVFSSDSFSPSMSPALGAMITYTESAYPDAPHHDMIVSGYDIGLQCSDRTQIEIAGIEVKDCTTGMSGECYFGLDRDTVRNTYIHDCIYGIMCDNLNLVNMNLYVYNCKETGVQITNQLTGPHLLEIYECKDGLIMFGNQMTQLHLQIHDNTGNGFNYKGNNSSAAFNCSMEIYNNKGWNICGDDVPMFQVAPALNNEFTCRLENGGLGNINIKLKGSSESNYILTPTHLKSDGGVYYVYPGKEVWISPSSSASWTEKTDWLEGCMVFDIENYTEKAVAAYAPEENVRTTSDQTENTWNFVRTHFFAAKEGWVIQYDKTVGSGPTMYPLVFTEGCNVTYDYETNGGTGMSETYAKISYLNGDAVDLSLTASRPGYEFIGWNTDPDAHEAISALTAQKKDITLYAIYRKAVVFTYHTYDQALDYTQSGYLFNKETLLYTDQAGSQKVNALSYADQVPQSVYNYVGYSYDGRDTTNLFQEGEVLSAEKTDIYCVYTMNGELRCLGPDGALYDQQKMEAFYTILNTLPYQYSYELKSFQAEKGYVFVGWRAADGMIYAPGSIYVTDRPSAVLQAEVNPITPEAPTLEAVTYEFGIVLGNVALPTDWKWKDSSRELSAGQQEYDAIYVPNGDTVKILVTVLKNPKPNYAVVQNLKGVEGSKLSTVALPAQWRWKNPSEILSLTENKYLAVFTHSSGNYEDIEVMLEITVTAKKADNNTGDGNTNTGDDKNHNHTGSVNKPDTPSTPKPDEVGIKEPASSVNKPNTPSTPKPQKGKIYTVGGIKYKVTNTSSKTVSVVGLTKSTKKKKTITIKKTVKIMGVTFKITEIGNNVFASCKKLKKVTIGANVTKIGKKAFYKCSELKTIIIQSKKIKSVGKNALKGINKKAVIKVPKSKLKKYKKLLKKKGQ